MLFMRGALGLLAIALVSGCEGAPPVFAGDGGTCVVDDDCDDGDFCTGREVCMAGACFAVTRCRPGQACDAAREVCVTSCSAGADADGDGVNAIECGGGDCDDSDPERSPGRVEVCDVADRDEDCDPSTFGVRDLDLDGVADARCCNVDAVGTATCGVDCDDTRSGVSPFVPEVCNGYDDDCDEGVDEGVLLDFWVDGDTDGYGSAVDEAAMMRACRRPMGFAPTNDDCDDDDGAVNPSAVEVCDTAMRDEDCSGAGNDVEGGCACTEPDDRVCPDAVGRCAGATQSCLGGSWGPCSVEPIVESCNAIDDDCDAMVDEGQTITCYLDADNDGYAIFGATATEECPDPTRMAAPFGGCPLFHTAHEPATPDVDSDCDDSSMTERAPTRCYRDGDGDGYGAGAILWRCPGRCTSGLVTTSTDCCDSDRNAHPGVTTFTATQNACGSWDWNCDRNVEPRYGAYSCRFLIAGCTANGSVGFADPVPGCGGAGGLRDRCMLTAPNTCTSSYSGSVALAVEACR